MLRISSIETEDPRSGRPSTLSRVGVVEFPENRSRLKGIAYAPESPLASRSGTERRTAATAVLDSIQRWGTGVRMEQQNAEVCFQGRPPRSSNLFKSMLMVVAFATMVGCGGGSTPVVQDTDHDSVPDSQDCAPNDSTKWQLLSFQSMDSDSDGHFVNSSGQVCAGSALPANYSTSQVAAGNSDCDDSSSARWQLLPYSAVDADSDGYAIAKAGQVCSGASLPTGYSTTPPDVSALDCDDSDPSKWRLMTIYVDADGDGAGAGAGKVTCVGSGAPAGFSLVGFDPLDDPTDPASASVSNPELSPWQFATPET